MPGPRRTRGKALLRREAAPPGMGWITEDRSENIVSKDQPVGIDHVLDHLHLEHAIGSRWGGRETGRGASPSE